MQYYAVNIPEKVGPGMQFYVQLGGQLLTVTCPAGAGPGTLIQVQAPAGIAPPPPPAPAVVMGAPFQTFDQPPPSAPGGVPAGAAREGSRWIVPPPYNPNPSQPGWIIAYPDPVPLPPSAEPTFRIPIDVDEPYANAAERRRAAVERRCVKVNQIRVVNACCCCYQGCYLDDNVVCGSWAELCCLHAACCMNAKKDDDADLFLRCGCCDFACNPRCVCRSACHCFFLAQACACPCDRFSPPICACLGLSCSPQGHCCARVETLKMTR